MKVKYSGIYKHVKLLGIKFKLKNKNIDVEYNDNIIEIDDSINTNNLYINIRGKNNKLIIKKICIIEKVSISIFAENSTFMIDDECAFRQLTIVAGVDNCNAGILKNHMFNIGKRVTIESCFIGIYCGNTELTIGGDCMFSNNITILNADSHPIYSKGTNTIINRSKNLCIGNHCWLGKNTTILKNVIIPNNTVIGCGSVVCGGGFNEENTAIAGNPAKVVKRGIDWSANGTGNYINNGAM